MSLFYVIILYLHLVPNYLIWLSSFNCCFLFQQILGLKGYSNTGWFRHTSFYFLVNNSRKDTNWWRITFNCVPLKKMFSESFICIRKTLFSIRVVRCFLLKLPEIIFLEVTDLYSEKDLNAYLFMISGIEFVWQNPSQRSQQMSGFVSNLWYNRSDCQKTFWKITGHPYQINFQR